jgi:shikimate kinase
MELPIILIGPMCSGKSTIAQLVAMRLGIPRYALDELRWAYYQACGFDLAISSEIGEREGMVGMMRYWKPFEAYAVERVVAEHADGVIDFGAGHSVQNDAALFKRVKDALAGCHVILLLPSPNPDEAIEVLNQRLTHLLMTEVGMVDPIALAINAQFAQHPCNYQLATHVLYTNGKTPDETCQELIAALGS